MSSDWIALFYVLIGLLAVIGPTLDGVSTEGEKKALAKKLNARFLSTQDSATAIPVFKVVFDTLDGVVLRVFGPRIASFRFVFSTIVGSGVFFWTYLLIMSTIMNDITILQFENNQTILAFLILTAFSIVSDVLSVAQTRLFLSIFRHYPTGVSFFVLFYSDFVMKVTLYIVVFSLGIAASLLATDKTINKSIPVAVYLPPEQSAGSAERKFCIEWRELPENPGYDYSRPLGTADTTITSHKHCVNIGDNINSSDEFIQTQFTGVEGVIFNKLTKVQAWPAGCVPSEDNYRCFVHTHIVYVPPLLSIQKLPALWWMSMGVAAGSALSTVAMPTTLLFIKDIEGMWSIFEPSKLCLMFTDFKSACDILGPLMIMTNPKITATVPLEPFFVGGLFLSVTIYLSAFALKFLTLIGKIWRKFLKERGLRVSERIPYTQASLSILLPFTVTIAIAHHIAG